MIICTVTMVGRKRDSKPFQVQFGFNGGYVGWITAHAQDMAKARKARIVNTADGYVVDCMQPRDNSIEWFGEIS